MPIAIKGDVDHRERYDDEAGYGVEARGGNSPPALLLCPQPPESEERWHHRQVGTDREVERQSVPQRLYAVCRSEASSVKDKECEFAHLEEEQEHEETDCKVS